MSPQALSRGAGLGLSLVKNIIDLHEGDVSIASNVGEGTTITIQIPLNIEQATEEDINSDFDDDIL